MKFFIDSANIEEIKQSLDLGIIEGVTTNPSLVAKTGKKYETCVQEIIKITDNPVNIEVLTSDYHTMVNEAHKYSQWGNNIVIKIPLTYEGLKTIKILVKKNIKVNATLCFSPIQALLAAKLGASYISLFIGRLDDIGYNGIELIKKVIKIYSNYSFHTKILTASIRNPLHIIKAAIIGADIATIPFHIINQIIENPLTNIGLKQFLTDWEKSISKN